MNILFIPTWYSGRDASVMTAGVFHYEQAMALKKYCNVVLYYPFDRELDVPFCRGEERGLLTWRRKMRANPAARFADYLRDFRAIRKDTPIDLIHGHVGSEAGLVAVFLGKVFHIPVVITEHNPIELANLQSAKSRLKNRLAYRGSRANICVSTDSARRLKEYFPDCRFSVIYNGVLDPKVPEIREPVRRENALNFSIVAAFYSRDIKGYQFLLPAVKALADQGVHPVLHICGGGEYLEYYQNMAKDLGIEDRCIFYGQCTRDRVYEIMSQMDFSVSASLFECSGVSVQEAMLLGKPLVVTRSGGADSLVTEQTAIVVDRGSTEALVQGIKTMADRLEDFDSRRIRAYAEENFEMDRVTRRYMSLYRSILGACED